MLGDRSPNLFTKISAAIPKISVQKIFTSKPILSLVQIGAWWSVFGGGLVGVRLAYGRCMVE